MKNTDFFLSFRSKRSFVVNDSLYSKATSRPSNNRGSTKKRYKNKRPHAKTEGWLLEIRLWSRGGIFRGRRMIFDNKPWIICLVLEIRLSIHRPLANDSRWWNKPWGQHQYLLYFLGPRQPNSSPWWHRRWTRTEFGDRQQLHGLHNFVENM